MNSHNKTLLAILGCCMFLWCTNWCSETTYEREIGIEQSGGDMRELGCAYGGLVSLLCTRRIWRRFRELLDSGTQISAGVRIWGDWRMLLCVLPLAFESSYQSQTVNDDGTVVTYLFQYGGAPSAYSIVWTAAAIMLYQTAVRLEALPLGEVQHQSTLLRPE